MRPQLPGWRRSTPARWLGLGRTVAATAVGVNGAEVRVVLVVGPRRLGELVERVLARLNAPPPADPAPAPADPAPTAPGSGGGEGP